MNDTYADFDRADLDGEDPSETKDDYDSENEDHIKRNVIVSSIIYLIRFYRFQIKWVITKLKEDAKVLYNQIYLNNSKLNKKILIKLKKEHRFKKNKAFK